MLNWLSNLIPIVLQIVPWVITIVGWYRVARDANDRETRKEYKADADAISRLIECVEEDAKKYLILDSKTTTKVEVQVLEDRIKRQLRAIGNRVRQLEPEINTSEAIKALAEFRSTCMSSDFESASRQAVSPSHSKVSDVSRAADDLQDALNAAFKRRFAAK